jgi:hypothetical protein
MLIQIRNEFQSEKPPEVSETDIGADTPQLYVCVERERSVIRHEAIEGITVEVIFMSWVSGPIRIRIVWRDDFYQTCWFGYPMKLADE